MKGLKMTDNKFWIVTEIKEWVDGSRTHDTVSIRLSADSAKAFAKRKNEQEERDNPRALQPVRYEVTGPFSVDEDQ